MKKLIFVLLLLVATSCSVYYEDPYMKSSENTEILASVDSTNVVYVVKRDADTYLVEDNKVTYELREESYFPPIISVIFILIAFMIGFAVAKD